MFKIMRLTGRRMEVTLVTYWRPPLQRHTQISPFVRALPAYRYNLIIPL
jgi:hypothetical protein